MRARTVVAAGAASVLLAGICGTPARAVTAVTVSSPACGVIAASAPAAALTGYAVHLDTGGQLLLSTRATSARRAGLAAGRYPYVVTRTDPSASGAEVVAWGSVPVAACNAASIRRTGQGARQGRSLADVLAVTSDGSLYRYNTAEPGGRLSPRIKVGHGWQSTTWLGRATETYGAGTATSLFSLRTDGSLWQYTQTPTGAVTAGHQVGHGFGGLGTPAILPTNNTLDLGHSLFLASQGGTLFSWVITPAGLRDRTEVFASWDGVRATMGARDISGDGFADVVTAETDGTFWAEQLRPQLLTQGATSAGVIESRLGTTARRYPLVYSPGDLTGDGRNDLVGRDTAGNLYLIPDAGTTLGAPVLIGVHWSGVRLLA